MDAFRQKPGVLLVELPEIVMEPGKDEQCAVTDETLMKGLQHYFVNFRSAIRLRQGTSPSDRGGLDSIRGKFYHCIGLGLGRRTENL